MRESTDDDEGILQPPYDTQHSDSTQHTTGCFGMRKQRKEREGASTKRAGHSNRCRPTPTVTVGFVVVVVVVVVVRTQVLYYNSSISPTST